MARVSLMMTILGYAVLRATAVGTPEHLADKSCPEEDGCSASGRNMDETPLIQLKSSKGGACDNCDSCEAVPGNTGGGTDAECAKCANGGYKWWPCQGTQLCRCADGQGTPPPPPPPPTSPPSPPPVTTTAAATTAAPATTATPQSPGTTTAQTGSRDCSLCDHCVAIPGKNSGGTDSNCAQCANGGYAWWPCNADLCHCADGGNPATTGAATSPPPGTTAMTPTSAPTTAAAGTTSPAPGSTTAPAGTTTAGHGAAKCTAHGTQCTYPAGAGISSWFTREIFTEMFPNICNTACHGCDMLTYDCLIAATLMYPDFASSDDMDANKREVAAWLGEMSQETTGGGCRLSNENPDGSCSCGPMWCDSHPGGGCSTWGLCFVEEAGGTYCSSSAYYPCVQGKSYKGRGPKQLSYNYNYGQFSEEFCGDKQVLLNNPDWVASNPTLAWASSIWFWFSGGACNPGETCKPGCHDVFLGRKKMCPADVAAGRHYGLGWVTNVINGGLECGGAGAGKCDYRVHSRVRFYKHFCDILGVNPLATGWTEDENLFCNLQKNYAGSPPTTC